MWLEKIKNNIAYLKGLIHIYLLRHVFHYFRPYNILRSSPRRCLEYRLFPYFYARDEFQNMLFVGVAGCTKHYEDYFAHKRSIYSIDIDPEKAVSGVAGRHIVDSVENIDKYFKDGSLDAVLMNGVYGWGLDNEEALLRSIEKIKKALRSGGVLLFGWDKVPKHDPINLDDKKCFSDFKRIKIFGKSRIELDNKHRHIYDVYVKP